jgi:hypothetical protein
VQNPPDGQISRRDKNLSSPISKNISLSPSGKSALPARPVLSRQEGRFAVVTNAGWDAVDAAALARKCVRRAVSVSEQQRADERRFNASAKTRRAAHGSSRALVEVAAYGEVVWSWHPLLMPSLAEIKSAQPGFD